MDLTSSKPNTCLVTPVPNRLVHIFDLRVVNPQAYISRKDKDHALKAIASSSCLYLQTKPHKFGSQLVATHPTLRPVVFISYGISHKTWHGNGQRTSLAIVEDSKDRLVKRHTASLRSGESQDNRG